MIIKNLLFFLKYELITSKKLKKNKFHEFGKYNKKSYNQGKI